ncbi:hypothetical protein D3C78_1606870 [compost metagenome]
MRPGEEQQQALVDHLAFIVVPGPVVGMPWLGFEAAQGDADGPRPWPGDPHDADPATTLGGGDGGDGFTGGVHD